EVEDFGIGTAGFFDNVARPEIQNLSIFNCNSSFLLGARRRRRHMWCCPDLSRRFLLPYLTRFSAPSWVTSKRRTDIAVEEYCVSLLGAQWEREQNSKS